MRLFCLLCLTLAWLPAQANCLDAAKAVNQKLSQPVDEAELASALDRLEASGNRTLPEKFITKRKARDAGWQPGRDLWSVDTLKGKSIGGDLFFNREGHLPKGRWKEADLDYRGGPRGAKRLVYSDDGRRQVTIDHYRTFVAVPACR